MAEAETRARRLSDIKVELTLDNTFRNLVEERFDAGVRLGEAPRGK